MATQGERRSQTRTALLDAAASLFAERGIADSSVDAIAESAGRTSGALYDHFGNKDGLLFALLEGWVDDLAVVLAAELVHTTTIEERMAALWHNISSPEVGNGRWLALEHEMWSYAVRNPAAMAHLADRYRTAWQGLGELASDDPGETAAGPAVLGTLLGLEMMRRVDPGTITEPVAIAALCAVAAPFLTVQPPNLTSPGAST